MSRRPSSSTLRGALGVLGVTVGLLPACSRGDDAAPPSTPPGATDGGAPVPAQPVQTSAPTSTGPPPSAPPPDTGVPGLDSDDAFCAAWSAFAGSFQVIAVASSFLYDQPQRAFELEVAGSITVTDAYAALGASWPADLEAERDAALDALLGPFATRATRARAVLERELPGGAEAVAAAWVDALATRDPENPDIALVVPADASTRLGAAALAFAESEQPVYADPALITDAETPRTDAYLLANCPDQGLLAGADVVEG